MWPGICVQNRGVATLTEKAMKNFLICLAIGGVLAGLWTVTAYSKSQEPKRQSEFMRKKLEHSQKVLEGIAIGDFEKISQNAAALLDLSKLAEWRVIKTPRYELHSNDFRRSAQNLIDEAKAKNLDGAALAYVDM